MFGRLRSSKRTGLTICLTEIRRTSSVVKKEKEIPETVDGMECEMFMTRLRRPLEDMDRPPGIFELLARVHDSCSCRSSDPTFFEQIVYPRNFPDSIPRTLSSYSLDFKSIFDSTQTRNMEIWSISEGNRL